MFSSDPSKVAEKEKESLGNRFVHHVAIPSLQTISSFRVTLSIWQSFISRTKHLTGTTWQNGEYDELAFMLNLMNGYREECHRMISCLKTPTSIQNYFRKCLSEILVETKKWLRQKTFSVHIQGSSRIHVEQNYIAWHPNGKIDYKKSVENICRTSVCNSTQKFLLMCEYCLEDEMKKFDLLSLPSDFLAHLTGSQNDFLVDYWRCYLSNTLHEIPLLGFENVNAVMAAKCDTLTWPAFDYFWDRLSETDQIAVARFWLTDSGILVFKSSGQLRLLSKMNWYQQHVLLGEIPGDIIFNFFVTLKSDEGTLWAWKHSSHTITIDQFNELIFRMKTYEETERFLALIWDTIPGHLRDLVIPYAEQRLGVLFNVVNPTATDLSLLCKYYPLKSSEFWKNLVFGNVSHFANFSGDPRPMNEFVKLCLTDPEELSRFKKSLFESNMTRYSGLRLLAGGKLDYLRMKLDFCCCDQKSVREYKKDLLMQTRVFEKGTYYTDLPNWYEISAFIDEAFDHDSSLALAQKKLFISSYANCWPHKYDPSDDESIENITRVVEMVFEDDDLRIIKKSFLKSFLKLRKNSSPVWSYKFICGTFFLNFVVKWCLNNEENAIREFKNTVPLEVIFAECVVKIENDYYKSKRLSAFVLEDMDFFLKWYLGDEQAIKKYKWDEGAKSCFEIVIDHILRQNDVKSLRALCKWSFGSDLAMALPTIKSKKLILAMKRFIRI